jgi:hypothetical protein
VVEECKPQEPVVSLPETEAGASGARQAQNRPEGANRLASSHRLASTATRQAQNRQRPHPERQPQARTATTGRPARREPPERPGSLHRRSCTCDGPGPTVRRAHRPPDARDVGTKGRTGWPAQKTRSGETSSGPHRARTRCQPATPGESRDQARATPGENQMPAGHTRRNQRPARATPGENQRPGRAESAREVRSGKSQPCRSTNPR